eukprot:13795087-Alexandrium_andersonii.AAC.1
MQHTAQLAVLETQGEARRSRAPFHRDRPELLLGQIQDGAHLGEAAKQEGPCLVRPQAVALRLRLKVESL